MKQIPKKKIFSKQHFGAPELNEAYFLYAGIFLHFWGLFEWVISKELYDQREKIKNHPEAKKDSTKEPKDFIKALNKCQKFEDVFRIRTGYKLKLLKLINPTAHALVHQGINNSVV